MPILTVRTILILAAAMLVLAVLIGAFGAHALAPLLEQNQRVATFETASRYHFYHAFGLLFVGILIQQNEDLTFRGLIVISFLFGILFFSGSLYILAISNIGWLGAITPVGGILFLVGWILLIIAIRNLKSLCGEN